MSEAFLSEAYLSEVYLSEAYLSDKTKATCNGATHTTDVRISNNLADPSRSLPMYLYSRPQKNLASDLDFKQYASQLYPP